MTSRFCRYIEKMFGFSGLVGMIEPKSRGGARGCRVQLL